MAEQRYYNDLRLLAKQANQRMVRLEKLQITSPAYDAIQGKLETLGRQKGSAKGRRFSESGKATYNEYMHTKKILEDFLGHQTSTISGTKKWEESIWQGALNSDKSSMKGLKESGITKADWLEFWKSEPANQKDRSLGSEVVVRIIKTYAYKNKKMVEEHKIDWQEIAEKIESSKTVKEAHSKLGVSYYDTKRARELGEL